MQRRYFLYGARDRRRRRLLRLVTTVVVVVVSAPVLWGYVGGDDGAGGRYAVAARPELAAQPGNATLSDSTPAPQMPPLPERRHVVAALPSPSEPDVSVRPLIGKPPAIAAPVVVAPVEVTAGAIRTPTPHPRLGETAAKLVVVPRKIVTAPEPMAPPAPPKLPKPPEQKIAALPAPAAPSAPIPPAKLKLILYPVLDHMSGETDRPSPVRPRRRPPERPNDVVAAKAFDVLQAHCARCHQSGAGEEGAAPVKFFHVLQMDQLARDTTLVRPGNPDGSPLYTSMVKREMPSDVYQTFDKSKGPTSSQIAAVRRWIEGLKPGTVHTAACGNRKFITQARLDKLIGKAQAATPASKRGTLRFITLTHQYNACASEQDMTNYRRDVVGLLNATSQRAMPIMPGAIDEQRTIIAVSLTELGWTQTDWKVFAGAAADGDATYRDAGDVSKGPKAVRADRFAGAVLASGKADFTKRLRVSRHQVASSGGLAQGSGRVIVDSYSPAGPGALLFAERPASVAGQSGAATLAQSYWRPLDLTRAASEFGLPAQKLVAALGKGGAEANELKQRLQQGVVPRREFDRRFAGILRESAKPLLSDSDAGDGDADETSGRGFHLSVWTDKAVYRRGETARIWARADRACKLTLINIDGHGRGTVIFPNDYDRDNTLTPGRMISVPREGAKYGFRLRNAGAERIVAVCNTEAASADGIIHDFEKQKFSYLGRYSEFLNKAIGREVTGRYRLRRKSKRRRRRSRRQGKPYYAPIIRRVQPEIQARTAIRIEIR